MTTETGLGRAQPSAPAGGEPASGQEATSLLDPRADRVIRRFSGRTRTWLRARRSEDPAAEHRTDQLHGTASPFSARLAILGWLLLTAAVGMVVLVVFVSTVLSSKAGQDANEAIAQELREVQSFAAEGVDPETGERFASAERLISVFVERQAPSPPEIYVGVRADGSVFTYSDGDRTPSRAAHDMRSETELLASLDDERSGILSTRAGEMRWGAVALTGEDGEPAYFLVGDYTDAAYAEVWRLTGIIAVIALAALAFAGLIGWLVSGRILRPIRQMRITASHISQDDLTERIPIRGNDDIAALGRTFNAMLDRIEGAFAAEQRFVDDAGHELRTPITIIRGQLELLSDDPVERAQAMDIVMGELDRMSRIVTDLLALAKAERHDFIVVERDVDVTALTLDVDAKLQALTPERRWVLSGIAEGTADLDAQRVTQALLQLADNAVRHTEAGSEIRFASDFADDDGEPVVRFTISDDGAGVRPEDAERIFDRFSRGSEPRGRTGSGLGLAIVRAIADGHGGWAYVDSVYGQGATFGIVLPLRRRAHGEPGSGRPGRGEEEAPAHSASSAPAALGAHAEADSAAADGPAAPSGPAPDVRETPRAETEAHSAAHGEPASAEEPALRASEIAARPRETPWHADDDTVVIPPKPQTPPPNDETRSSR